MSAGGASREQQGLLNAAVSPTSGQGLAGVHLSLILPILPRRLLGLDMLYIMRSRQ
jgi:hypothetical protein